MSNGGASSAGMTPAARSASLLSPAAAPSSVETGGPPRATSDCSSFMMTYTRSLPYTATVLRATRAARAAAPVADSADRSARQRLRRADVSPAPRYRDAAAARARRDGLLAAPPDVPPQTA